MLNWNNYKNFKESEFTCHCGCGLATMEPKYMLHLQMVREIVGFGMTVTSGYRCAAYNKKIGGGPEHILGKAADIKVAGELAFSLLAAAVQLFPRIGVSQNNPDHTKRFLHLGSAKAQDDLLSPWIWSY